MKTVINIQQRARSNLTKKNQAAAKIQAAVKGKKVRKNVEEIKEIDEKIAKQKQKHSLLKGKPNKNKRNRSNRKRKKLETKRAKLVSELEAKNGGRRTRRRKRKFSKN
jgi:hypothetical protein